jgi:hypothetical protein
MSDSADKSEITKKPKFWKQEDHGDKYTHNKK